ncbi:MAG: hypothetical protein ABIK92_11975 [Pseudomonadota bacterium]
MNHLTNAAARSFATLFLTVLVIHMSLVIPRTEWLCRCGDEILHSDSCCCNCPKCVEKRDGLLSYCNGPEQKHKETRQRQFLENMGCSCGLGQVVLNLPGDSPFLPLDQIAGIFPTKIHKAPSKINGFLSYVTFLIVKPPG